MSNPSLGHVLQEEIDYFSQLPVSVIEPFGRSGTDFLSGLLEGHPQIATLPGKFLPKIYQVNFLITDKVAIRSALELARFDQSFRLYRTDYDQRSFDLYCLEFIEHLGAFTPRNLLKAVHFGWEKVNNRNVLAKKQIIWHSHGALFDKAYGELFKSLKDELSIILCCRDPRESIVSYYDYKSGVNSFDYPSWEHNQFLLNGLSLKRIADQLEIYREVRLRHRVYFHRVEFMNERPRESLEALCARFDLEFHEHLLEPKQQNHSGRGHCGFDSRSNVVRWPCRLGKSSTLGVVEALFFRPLIELRYPEFRVVQGRADGLLNAARILLLFVSFRFYFVTFVQGWRNAKDMQIREEHIHGVLENGGAREWWRTKSILLYRKYGRMFLFSWNHIVLFNSQVFRISKITIKSIFPEIARFGQYEQKVDCLLTLKGDPERICLDRD